MFCHYQIFFRSFNVNYDLCFRQDSWIVNLVLTRETRTHAKFIFAEVETPLQRLHRSSRESHNPGAGKAAPSTFFARVEALCRFGCNQQEETQTKTPSQLQKQTRKTQGSSQAPTFFLLFFCTGVCAGEAVTVLNSHEGCEEISLTKGSNGTKNTKTSTKQPKTRRNCIRLLSGRDKNFNLLVSLAWQPERSDSRHYSSSLHSHSKQQQARGSDSSPHESK